jgi:dolichol-phosphate mannosyltransferase
VLVDASPVPETAVGKAWGLYTGLGRTSGDWVLTLDADSIIGQGLTRSLAAFVARNEVDALSVATRQSAPGPLLSLLHPSFLTTLVYRFGPPGFIARDPHSVLANGQCFFASKAALEESGAFEAALSSLCEDITIARTLTRSARPVGFFEAEIPVDVEMYSSGAEVWANWPRSLAMRDQYPDAGSASQLAQLFLVQAAPLPLALVAVLTGLPLWFFLGQALLLAMRLGVLAGTRSAYSRLTATFWLSPLADLPVAIRLLQMTLKRRFVWRGRVYVRGKDGSLRAIGGAARGGAGSLSPSS